MEWLDKAKDVLAAWTEENAKETEERNTVFAVLDLFF